MRNSAVVCTSIPVRMIASLLLVLTYSSAEEPKSRDELDFYSFTVMDIHDNIVSLEQYRGKVSMVVNVASECGYTDNHYKSLMRLQELFQESNMFNILAFPCNQFGKQEPSSNDEIYNFAVTQYGANFPMFAKVNVIGREALDAWHFLADTSGSAPDWNFWKYLVDHRGQVIKAWGPWQDPDRLYGNINNAIKKALAASTGTSSKDPETVHDGGEL